MEDGILLALVLSLLQHVRHSYEPSVGVKTRTADGQWQMSPLELGRMAAPGLLVYWFGSDLFYANIDRFAHQARKLATESPSPMRWLVVDAGAITSVDYTAGGTLKELVKDLAQHGVALVFAHISESLKADLDRQGLTEVISADRQFETLRECLAAYGLKTPRRPSGNRALNLFPGSQECKRPPLPDSRLRNPAFRRLWLATGVSGSWFAANNTAVYWALNSVGANILGVSNPLKSVIGALDDGPLYEPS